ncbi:MAG: glycosyltransferase family 4 protein [Vicinamibacterales bacterium]
MKILVLAQVLPPRRGGSGRWIWELYRRLPGMDVTLVAGACDGDRAFDGTTPVRINRLPLDFASWGLLSPAGSLQYARTFARLRAMVSSDRPDQVHCAKALPEGLLGFAMHQMCGVPYICYAHGEELRLASTSRELRWLTHRVLRTASRVVANSAFTRGILLDEWRLPDDKVSVLHPGVDTTHFVPASPDAQVRARLGWSGRRVVLTVGTMQKRKGQDMVIRALPAIREACPEVLYVIAGPGLERAYLEALAHEHGVVDAVQFLDDASEDDLLACYQQCDLFVLANRQIGWDVEGFGMVLVEAQACGKPVIAGRSGGTTDTLHENVTGLLIDADTSESVAQAILPLLMNPQRLAIMGAHARQWAVDRCDWAPLVAQASQMFAGSDTAGVSERSVQPA